jgi:hypothetical protein
MMEAIKRNPFGKFASILFATFLFIFSPTLHLYAQQQLSTFTIAGWTPGTTPVYTGINSNVIDLTYGDNLNTTVAFIGSPNDGLGTDYDNIAYMSFSYSYTMYLTPAGNTFSTATSIPVGTHTISAYQSCSSGITPPWTLGCDAQSTVYTNKLDMHTADGINDCIPIGNYQVDIVFNNYSINSVGPNPSAIQLEWYGYADNSSVRGLSALAAPSTANNSGAILSPASSYILNQVAFVHVSSPTACPPLAISMPTSIHTFASVSSATVSASYPGQCVQNAFTYLWSDGETTATATGLHHGIYTVTVTAPCGNTATASVTISEITDPNMAPIAVVAAPQPIESAADHAIAAGNKTYKEANSIPEESSSPQATVNLYPNPAKQRITFDLKNMNSAYTLRILDILGNEVMIPATGASAEAGYQKISVDLDLLPAGAYLYELVTDHTYRGKFIKQ